MGVFNGYEVVWLSGLMAVGFWFIKLWVTSAVKESTRANCERHLQLHRLSSEEEFRIYRELWRNALALRRAAEHFLKEAAEARGVHQAAEPTDSAESSARVSPFMAVPIQTTPRVSRGTPRVLPYFQSNRRTYDVARDGRFLMVKSSENTSPPQVNFVLNWDQELLARVPIP